MPDEFPTTYLQQALVEAALPDEPVVTTLALEIAGADAAAVIAALRTVVSWHDGLRAQFRHDGTTCWQRPRPTGSIDVVRRLDRVDRTGVDDTRAELPALLEAALSRGLNLRTGVTWRGVLVATDASLLLACGFARAVFDRRSTDVLARHLRLALGGAGIVPDVTSTTVLAAAERATIPTAEQLRWWQARYQEHPLALRSRWDESLVPAHVVAVRRLGEGTVRQLVRPGGQRPSVPQRFVCAAVAELAVRRATGAAPVIGLEDLSRDARPTETIGPLDGTVPVHPVRGDGTLSQGAARLHDRFQEAVSFGLPAGRLGEIVRRSPIDVDVRYVGRSSAEAGDIGEGPTVAPIPLPTRPPAVRRTRAGVPAITVSFSVDGDGDGVVAEVTALRPCLPPGVTEVDIADAITFIVQQVADDPFRDVSRLLQR